MISFFRLYSLRLLRNSLIVLTYCTIGCGGETKDKSESNYSKDSLEYTIATVGMSLKLEEMSDEDKLFLIKFVPKRITYEETKAILPQLGDLKIEGSGNVYPPPGLYEAFMDLELMGRTAVVEFNYQHDSLYAYYFYFWNIDSVTAERIYIQLQEFYTSHLGKYVEETESWEHYSQNSSWVSDTISVHVGKTIYTRDRAYIGWGFQ